MPKQDHPSQQSRVPPRLKLEIMNCPPIPNYAPIELHDCESCYQETPVTDFALVEGMIVRPGASRPTFELLNCCPKCFTHHLANKEY
jgi:hypothetical protein